MSHGVKCLTMIFELWRQDDNGNKFLIEVFTDRILAELRLAELSSNIHKQTYWIVEKQNEPPSPPSPRSSR
ncbi:MAG TPA: hypothetical protein VF799_02550 [Geobacteraceae bacterium]